MDDSRATTAAPSGPARPSALRAWWKQGLRSAFLLRPNWDGLQATPRSVALLVLVPYLAVVLIERLYVDGPAAFYGPAVLGGWLGAVVTIWVCWWLVPGPADAGVDAEANTTQPASAAALFAMFFAQAFTLVVVSGLLFVPLVRSGYFTSNTGGRWGAWAVWIVAVGWHALAQLALVWRTGSRREKRVGAMALLLGSMALNVALDPPRHWYPSARPDAQEVGNEPFKLTQELTELQPQILKDKLNAIGAGRPGIVNVYAITFSPYADEDVFQRESELVATLMEQRFGAAGRTVQLVNHPKTVREWPWATPLNLQRTIQRMAQVMDRDEDLLFIHLTSHGARAGDLAAAFEPLTVASLTPQRLRQWLDEAGIRNRVISVSACYSGSWIEPFSDPGTLVMTPADASHTSYGCGRGSTLTYFGRAMFDEQLRHTWSFEKAHAAARTVIEQREREAGKKDGYSNPQIRIGARVRQTLARLEAERASGVD